MTGSLVGGKVPGAGPVSMTSRNDCCPRGTAANGPPQRGARRLRDSIQTAPGTSCWPDRRWTGGGGVATNGPSGPTVVVATATEVGRRLRGVALAGGVPLIQIHL